MDIFEGGWYRLAGYWLEIWMETGRMNCSQKPGKKCKKLIFDMHWHLTRSRIQSQCRGIWGIDLKIWESVASSDMSPTCPMRHFLLR
jgi:hypothetical protein